MRSLIARLLRWLINRFLGDDDAQKAANKSNETVLSDLEKGDSASLTRSGGDDLDRLRDR